MTGRNANVFYEVGYAHAREKLCTLLTKDANDIPFDLKHHRHLIYGESLTGLKSQLISEFDWLKSELSGRRNPISVTLRESWARLDAHKTYGEVVISLEFMLANRTGQRSPDIEAIYLITSSKWSFRQAGEKCANLADEKDKNKIRHFIKPPVARLSPGAWAQVRVDGTQWIFPGENEALESEYQFKGVLWLEVVTSKGTFSSSFEVDLDTAEIPF